MSYKLIGRRLQLAREEAGLSQEQLATRLGCSQSTLSNYEKGKRRLYLAQLEKIARVLNKPLEYFMQPLTEEWPEQNLPDVPGRKAAGSEPPESPNPILPEADAQKILQALAALSPPHRRLAVDFILWLKKREEENNGKL
ncbi:MAG: helix-turn-helix domain-containing protein [Desulfurispora sp.]|uniref:helix-turn-helix domain-containing protein n=1 Tax=Desulfurispora sp. TaxID=3014275 RepID=UPI0040494D2F